MGRFPLSPIWDAPKRTGSVDVGSTPGTPLPPTLSYVGFEAETTLESPQVIIKYGSLYLVRGDESLLYMDVSSPNTPVIDSYAAVDSGIVGIGGAAISANDLIWVTAHGSAGSVLVYDALGDPDYFTTVTDSDMAFPKDVQYSEDHDVIVVVGGTDLAAGTYPGFLATLDASTGTVEGAVNDDLLIGAWSVAVDGNYAYVACYDWTESESNTERLVVVDISDPSNPSVETSLLNANLAEPAKVVKSGSYVYVSSVSETHGYLTVIDVSTPTSPTLVGQLGSTDLAGIVGFDVSGNYAYAAVGGNSDPAVAVIDLTNKASPSFASSATHGSLNWPYGVLVDGSYVYVTDINGDAFFVFQASS